MTATAAATTRGTDALRERIADYAMSLRFDDLDADTVHDTTLRFVDTVGALLGGFDGNPCVIARSLAEQVAVPSGATVLGTTLSTTPDLAAFANGTTSRYAELNDVYHWPGSAGGHPSDVVMPVFAAAEYGHASGRQLIVGIVLAYEIYLRFADATRIPGFDSATFVAIGSAVGAGSVLGLDATEMRNCISLAVLPNNALRQARTGHLSMWKAAAAGQAARGGVFAALLAKAGMQGPELPFEGTGGWLNAVARGPVVLDDFGGNGVRFKVRDTLIKPRASCATTISSILAAEHAYAAAGGPVEVELVLVETYRRAKEGMGTGEHHWNPSTRETADHSIPYVVSATLLDGTVGPTQFDPAHLANPRLRRILERVEVVEVPQFTEAYENHPVRHRTRVTVRTADGRTFTGESGGHLGDLSNPPSDADVTAKFHGVAKPRLGADQAERAAVTLWALAAIDDVAALPAELVVR